MHPRNRHQDRYDLARLVEAVPALRRHVLHTPAGEPSIDFADPAAVRLLNRALLHSQYGIDYWEIPAAYLCPPIPGRADYLHGLADLLATDPVGVIPRGPNIRALDLGTGASCIFPLLGHTDYGWTFVGTDVDPGALASAQAILNRNHGLDAVIQLRRQHDPARLLVGVVQHTERFDLCLCNPPFHRSAAEAAQGSTRKWRNLGKAGLNGTRPALNFGGRPRELWCAGGELAFVRQLIDDSAQFGTTVCWFSSLVAKREHLPQLQQHAQRRGAHTIRVVPMAQGQKQSRFLAWSFLDAAQRQHWRQQRWTT